MTRRVLFTWPKLKEDGSSGSPAVVMAPLRATPGDGRGSLREAAKLEAKAAGGERGGGQAYSPLGHSHHVLQRGSAPRAARIQANTAAAAAGAAEAGAGAAAAGTKSWEDVLEGNPGLTAPPAPPHVRTPREVRMQANAAAAAARERHAQETEAGAEEAEGAEVVQADVEAIADAEVEAEMGEIVDVEAKAELRSEAEAEGEMGESAVDLATDADSEHHLRGRSAGGHLADILRSRGAAAKSAASSYSKSAAAAVSAAASSVTPRLGGAARAVSRWGYGLADVARHIIDTHYPVHVSCVKGIFRRGENHMPVPLPANNDVVTYFAPSYLV